MAEAQRHREPERATSTTFLAIGVLIGIVIAVIAFVVDPDFGWPVLALVAVCLAAALTYRVITDRGGGDADASNNIPRQQPRAERPLGDTPEAHDEIKRTLSVEHL